MWQWNRGKKTPGAQTQQRQTSKLKQHSGSLSKAPVPQSFQFLKTSLFVIVTLRAVCDAFRLVPGRCVLPLVSSHDPNPAQDPDLHSRHCHRVAVNIVHCFRRDIANSFNHPSCHLFISFYIVCFVIWPAFPWSAFFWPTSRRQHGSKSK